MSGDQKTWDSNRIKLVLAGFCLIGIWLLIGPGETWADVRESVKKSLPATVGIEWRDKASKSPNHVNMASGTIVSADGLIVSVIQGSKPQGYSVTLTDGRVFEGRMLVDDRRSKLKLLKIDATDLPFLAPFHQPVQIGEEVTTTACEDLKNRIAVRGIIAAKDKQLDGLGDGLLQLDMTLSPMSGGAPVVDDHGRLLGIVAFLRVGKPISFAAPTWQIQALLDAHPNDSPTVIQRGRLGVTLHEINEKSGSVIAHPIPESPAANAGMKEGDLILTLDEQTVNSQKELLKLVNRRAAGDTVRLKIRRENQDQELEITLAPAPDEPLPDESSKESNTSAPASPWKVVRPGQILFIDHDNVVRTVTGEAAEEIIENLKKSPNTPAAVAVPVGPTSPRAPEAAAKSPTVPQAITVVPFQPSPPAKVIRLGPAVDGPWQGGPAPLKPKPNENSEQHTVASIRVERSNLEKKLEQMSGEIQLLRDATKKLTEEVDRLRATITSSSGEVKKPE